MDGMKDNTGKTDIKKTVSFCNLDGCMWAGPSSEAEDHWSKYHGDHVRIFDSGATLDTPVCVHEVPRRPLGDMVASALWDVEQELNGALRKFGKFQSAHEGYAVILEELDELWQHVKLKRECRDHAAMRKESMQTAAMAIRFMLDVCGESK